MLRGDYRDRSYGSRVTATGVTATESRNSLHIGNRNHRPKNKTSALLSSVLRNGFGVSNRARASSACKLRVHAVRARTSSRRIRSNGCRSHRRRIAIPLTLMLWRRQRSLLLLRARSQPKTLDRAACTSGFVSLVDPRRGCNQSVVHGFHTC